MALVAEAPDGWDDPIRRPGEEARHPWTEVAATETQALWLAAMAGEVVDEVQLPWLGGGAWRVHARAGRGVAWNLFLDGANYTLALDTRRGRARLTSKAAWLAQVGPPGVLAETQRLHGRLYGSMRLSDGGHTYDALHYEVVWRVARLDLTSDYAGLPIPEIDRDAWITRSGVTEYDQDPGRDDDDWTSTEGRSWRTGFEVGSRTSPIMGVVYNKTAEMRRSPKPWLAEHHRERGWDGVEPITRVEIRLQGERGLMGWGQDVQVDDGVAYQRYDLRRPDIALGRWDEWLPQAWATLTGAVPGRGWLRLAEPDPDDSNRSRWPTDPRWRGVQSHAVVGSLVRQRVSLLRLEEARRRAEDRLLSAVTSLVALDVVAGTVVQPTSLVAANGLAAAAVGHAMTSATARYTRRVLGRRWRPGDPSQIEQVTLRRIDDRVAVYLDVQSA